MVPGVKHERHGPLISVTGMCLPRPELFLELVPIGLDAEFSGVNFREDGDLACDSPVTCNLRRFDGLMR